MDIKAGRGWDPSLNGRMPDSSATKKNAPEGAITGQSTAHS